MCNSEFHKCVKSCANEEEKKKTIQTSKIGFYDSFVEFVSDVTKKTQKMSIVSQQYTLYIYNNYRWFRFYWFAIFIYVYVWRIVLKYSLFDKTHVLFHAITILSKTSMRIYRYIYIYIGKVWFVISSCEPRQLFHFRMNYSLYFAKQQQQPKPNTHWDNVTIYVYRSKLYTIYPEKITPKHLPFIL